MKLSKIISVILHPILMPIVTFYTSLKLVPNIGIAISSYINLIWIILVVSTIILPSLSLLYLKYIGKIESFEMTEHKDRPLPLLITGVWMLIGLRLLDYIPYLAPVLKIELICAIIIVLLASIISRFWKISLHMLGVGGLVGVVFSFHTLYGGFSEVLILFMLISGLVGVARIKQKAHNHNQIYVGFAIGFTAESAGILMF